MLYRKNMAVEYTKEDLESVIAGGDEDCIRVQACNLDYKGANPVKAALIVARVLLYPSVASGQGVIKLYNKTNTVYEQWMDKLRCEKKNRKAIMAGRWLMVYGLSNLKMSLYPIFLFNRDYGQSRKIFNKFLTYEKTPPPYLDLVWANLFHEALGLSYTEIQDLLGGPFQRVAQHMNTLLDDRNNIVETWLKNKRQSLRFYGGKTNTIIGLYDRIFADKATGIDYFNKDAARRYDLGGGFNTCEIERLFGRSFVSADIKSPWADEHDPDIIIQEVSSSGRIVIADTETHSRHFAKQARVGYLKFNVLDDAFPLDAESYSIVSTGFMTSTVRANIGRELKKKGHGHILLSLHAILRVVELAALGKDVDLFTVQRATSRSYKYKTCLLQWRRGRMIRLVTTDDKKQRPWSQDVLSVVYDSINPENKEFKAYLPTL